MNMRGFGADGPWYGVKTLYRSTAVGRPKVTDSAYDPAATLIEERVVLFKARSFHEAIRAAEKEARSYARGDHINPYGQKVKMHYLGACNAYHLFFAPVAGAEVFSSTTIVGLSVRDNAIVHQRMGTVETLREARRRKKFYDREFSGIVKRGV
jgi:hypothetical protein